MTKLQAVTAVNASNPNCLPFIGSGLKGVYLNLVQVAGILRTFPDKITNDKNMLKKVSGLAGVGKGSMEVVSLCVCVCVCVCVRERECVCDCARLKHVLFE